MPCKFKYTFLSILKYAFLRNGDIRKSNAKLGLRELQSFEVCRQEQQEASREVSEVQLLPHGQHVDMGSSTAASSHRILTNGSNRKNADRCFRSQSLEKSSSKATCKITAAYKLSSQHSTGHPLVRAHNKAEQES